jgi:hypothetical protein
MVWASNANNRVLGEVEHGLAVVVGHIAYAIGRDANDIAGMHAFGQGCQDGRFHAGFVLLLIFGGIKRGMTAMPTQVVAQHKLGLGRRGGVIDHLEGGNFVVEGCIQRFAAFYRALKAAPKP